MLFRDTKRVPSISIHFIRVIRGGSIRDEKWHIPADFSILPVNGYGSQSLSPSMSRLTNPLILRLFLTTGRSFKKRLTARGMGARSVEEVYRNLPLPHFIWVCEISHTGIYPETVLGEIIWDATRNPYEPDGWITLHYPEVLVVDQGSALNGKQNLLTIPITSPNIYPIFENNLVRV